MQRAAAPVRPLVPLAEWAAAYLPSYYPLGPSSFHRWLVAELSGLHTRRGSRVNVLAPRGAAKSTWSSFAYPLWCAVHGLEPYIVLTADTGEQAEKYLEAIRDELETNEAIRRDYPQAGPGGVWRGNRIRLANGSTIEALGTGAKLRGRKARQHRPSLVIVDDPQNTAHMLSALQRDRSWDWLAKDVSNAGSPQTNIIVLGTALHRDCIVCRLQRTAGWRSHLFRAVVAWPDRMDLWREWENVLLDHQDDDREAKARAFYEGHRADMDRGALVLWPERESLYSLMSLRASIGTGAFGSEKQNDPTDPTTVEWPPEYFERADLWFEEWPADLVVKVIAIDPSKGKDARRGDYSAIVSYGRDRRGVEYFEADLARRDVDAICHRAAERTVAFIPDGLALEGNAWQDLMAVPLRAALQQAGATVGVTLLDNTAPKPVRIRRHTGPLAQRVMRFKAKSPGTALMVEQFRDFPFGSHDDGPDAAEMARRLAIEIHNGRQAPRPATRARA